MGMGQEQPAPFYCPRCGGKMYKPAGSTLYWHADNNHPACEITNIPETAKIASTGGGMAGAQPAAEQAQKQQP